MAALAVATLTLGACGSDPEILVANPDTASMTPGSELTIDLLANDINDEGGELWMGGLLTDQWAPGEIVDQNRQTGTVVYRAPTEPGEYTFEYRLYDYDPTLSIENPNQSVTGQLTVTVE